jgi:hypothetical protein
MTTYRYPLHNPRHLNVVSDRYGFRNSRELDEPDERLRVMVVGDSFVFGEGVEEAERFTNVLESSQPAWRIDNLGMTGFGPDLMLRALEAVGLARQPDVVVFSMYTDDFRRVRRHYIGVGFATPRFVLQSGQLVTVPYPKPRPWERLRLYQILYRATWKYINTLWQLNEAILDRFLTLADVHTFTPVIIFLPGRGDTGGDKERRTWLQQYAKRHDTPFLDLTDPIHQAGQKAFIPRNPHLNPYGHQIVAAELRRFLEKQSFNER